MKILSCSSQGQSCLSLKRQLMFCGELFFFLSVTWTDDTTALLHGHTNSLSFIPQLFLSPSGNLSLSLSVRQTFALFHLSPCSLSLVAASPSSLRLFMVYCLFFPSVYTKINCDKSLKPIGPYWPATVLPV